MNSCSIVNVCLMLGMLGLALDASANLINCNKASAKWFEPVIECEEASIEFHNSFNFSFKAPTIKWYANDSFFLAKDDLNSAQFVVVPSKNAADFVTDNQLIALCVDNDECQKSSQSLIRHYPGGASVRVPEPAPMLLIILGLLGLGLVRRRLG